MFNYWLQKYFIFFYGVLFFYSCKPARFVPDHSYLLTSNQVRFTDDPLFAIEESNIEYIIKQKPNTKIFFFIPLKLYLYNFGNRIFKSNPENWVSRKLGEPPVEIDTLYISKTKQQLKLFLNNKGYLDCDVLDSIYYNPTQKKSRVVYFVKLNSPYRLQNLSYIIEDDSLVKDIASANKKTLLVKGGIFDVDLFDKDRENLVKEMRNRGYLSFSDEHIRYEIDTNSTEKRFNVQEIIVNPIKYKNDSLLGDKHQKHYIGNIHFSSKMMSNKNSDSSLFLCKDGYCFDHEIQRELSTYFLKQNIFTKPGTLYKKNELDFTYGRLRQLNIFKGINIKTDIIETDTMPKVNLHIFTPLLPRNAISFETNGTNRHGNLGLQGFVNYRRRNPFKYAETFEIRLRMGAEAQKYIGIEEVEDTEGERVFNTLEYGIESRLNIPKILFPFWEKKFSKLYAPKTEITGLFNYQKIQWFERDVLGFEWNYSWSGSEFNSFQYSLANVNVVRVNKTESFENFLKEINNPFFSNTYINHFILGSRLQYAYTNKPVDVDVRKNNFSYRVGIESSGNMLRYLYELKTHDTLPGKVFGIQFAQFVRFHAEYRTLQVLRGQSKNANNKVDACYRIFYGMGIPLKNSLALPFEKSFFAGGANGIRAWRIRTLGPGSFNQDISSFYKIGDIHIEGNAELRFDIISIFKGALFIDAGNIWLLNEDKDRPNAEFKWNRFYKEIAVGSGFGLRLDFSFFVVRFDWGLQVHDPLLPEGERWIFQNKPQFEQQYNRTFKPGSNFNIGIDYPF